jgi:poly-beta-1,6-N-acetyl-D-glucosamine synthase
MDHQPVYSGNNWFIYAAHAQTTPNRKDMMILLIIAIIIVMGYVTLILLFSVGIFRLKKSSISQSTHKPGVSIIVPFKNEEQHLPALIQSLLSLHDDQRGIEVIFVNDHSTDNSTHIINNTTNIPKETVFRIIHLEHENGKKAAQLKGIKTASFDILMFTDADCIVPQFWVKLMTEKLQNNSMMVCGPVTYQIRNNVCNLFYRTDFSSLVLSSAGAIGIGKPVFCNAANMLIKKEAYQTVHDKIRGKSHASGDDVFLLHAITSQFGADSVMYCFDNNALVSTSPPKNFISFIRQRIRWASKSVSYTNTMALFSSWIVFLMSISICMLAVLHTKTSLIACAAALFIKILADSVLFFSGRAIKGCSRMYLYHILFQPIYPVYIAITAILAVTLKPKWKHL